MQSVGLSPPKMTGRSESRLVLRFGRPAHPRKHFRGCVFSAVFRQAAVGMAQIDTQTGRFVRVNQKYADIVGYSVAQMCKTDFQSISHPEDLVVDLARLERLKAGERL